VQSIRQILQNIFTGDRKEQILLAGVAGFGVLLAIFALVFLSGGGGGDSTPADDDQPTATATLDDAGTASATNTRAATATAKPTGSPTVDPSATVTEDPDGTQTPSGDANQGSDGSGSNPATATRPPAATATPVPTATPAASSLAYCDTSGSGSYPTGAVLGLVTVGGNTAPAGTIVYVAFNGVLGPSEPVTLVDGKAGYSLNYWAAGTDCANQVGAAISVVVNGQSFPTGEAVGSAPVPLSFNVDAN
jgi:hypothetical protein